MTKATATTPTTTTDANDSKKVTATSKKVTLSDGKIIEIRKPKLRDIRTHYGEPNPEERQVLILMSLSEMTSDELDDLPYEDFMKLLEAANTFFPQAGMTV